MAMCTTGTRQTKPGIRTCWRSKASLDAAKSASACLLTRAPNQLKIVKAALASADAPDASWSEKVSFVSSKEGATYRWLAREAEHEVHALRLIVVESSALGKKKENTLTREREAECDRLTQAAKERVQTSFHCQADAEQAAEAFRATTLPSEWRGEPMDGTAFV